VDRVPASAKGLFPLMSPEQMHPPAPRPKTKYIFFKMRERSANGTRLVVGGVVVVVLLLFL
jgi:hypothetical protein